MFPQGLNLRASPDAFDVEVNGITEPLAGW
jgi:hypothetical protein